MTSAFIVCAIWRGLLSESKSAIIGIAACIPCGGAGRDVVADGDEQGRADAVLALWDEGGTSAQDDGAAGIWRRL
ncbi:hypothetical protein [Xanthomonas bromi]|uniref:Uncharacterized protein n=1 Tax=Xanthomonas bromi TaxID=56449 RepID=A0ABX5BS11_9XANT|nr:hypothetical protein [Xanthomonas bromi]PPV07822.1 hypothetical protein XbrCFBP1976_05970 [Xanthomonas bromi]